MLPLAMESSNQCGGGGGESGRNCFKCGEDHMVRDCTRTGDGAGMGGGGGLPLIQPGNENSLIDQQRNVPPSSNHFNKYILYKAELCKFFEEFGNCKYGISCHFAHGHDDLRAVPRHPDYKTIPCWRYHHVGFCYYGSRCFYIHETPIGENNENQWNWNSDGNRSNGWRGGNGPPLAMTPQVTQANDMITHHYPSIPWSSSTSSSSDGLWSGEVIPIYHLPHAPTGLVAASPSYIISPYMFQYYSTELPAVGSQESLTLPDQNSWQAYDTTVEATSSLFPVLPLSQSPNGSQPMSPLLHPWVPSLTSSSPLSPSSNVSASPHGYVPENVYLESSHRLPVFRNLAP